MDRRGLIVGGIAIGTAWLAECRADRAAPEPTRATTTPTTSPSPRAIDPTVTDTIATGLNVPWSIVFLADGSALVGQRDAASIVRVGAAGDVTKVGDVPGVATGGEAGLLGLALRPGDESWVYAFLTTPDDGRVVRLAFDGERIGEPEPVITGFATATNHHGGALLFDDAGHLFVAVGDALDPQSAQDPSTLTGTILRITVDGDPVDGNPFDNEVWSYGHRNVEGLAWDGAGRLWATEFGDKGGDELNLITRGRNYGWPLVEGDAGGERFTRPQATWGYAEASPAGVAISGDRAFVAALRGQRLWQVPLEGGTAGPPRDFLVGAHGRLRAVAAAPDGALWLGTSNTDGRGSPTATDDRILRVAITG